LALGLGVLLLALVLVLNAVIALLRRWRERADQGAVAMVTA
jgi:tungstate transport system permease protein